MYVGETKVVTPGKVGIEVRTFRETYLDGKLDSRKLVEQKVDRAAGDPGAAGRHQDSCRSTRRRPTG